VGSGEVRTGNVQGGARRYACTMEIVVPSGEPWPEEMWGMNLGTTVSMIRSKDCFVCDDPERRQVLDDMSFVWKVNASTAEKNRDAAAHYGRVRRGLWLCELHRFRTSI